MAPIYYYKCSSCEHKETKNVPSSKRDEEMDCSKCETPTMKRNKTQLPNHNYLRSANADRFERTKQRLDAEIIMYGLPPEDRENYEKHLEDLKVAENNERGPSDKEDMHKHQSGIDITK
jgi:hypothetical protein